MCWTIFTSLEFNNRKEKKLKKFQRNIAEKREK